MTFSYRAVLFDFDGTLADAYTGIAASVNHVRGVHGLPPLEEAEVKRFVGRGPVYLLQNTVPGGDIETDLARYRAHHPTVMCSGTRLLPGAAECVAALHRAGIKLAVCSNKPVLFSRPLLDYLGLLPFLDTVVGPEEVLRPKPAPDMLLLGLERLGVASPDALYIGDMTVDIATARAAGVTVWVVPTGSEERDTLAAARPDRLLRDLHELAELASS